MTTEDEIKELIWKHFGPAPEYTVYNQDDCVMCGRPMRPHERVEGYVLALAKDLQALIAAAVKEDRENIKKMYGVTFREDGIIIIAGNLIINDNPAPRGDESI